MQAEWVRLTSQLLDGNPAAWKNIWWAELRTVYGDALATPDLLHSTCRFALLDVAAGPSELEKVALTAWGSLRKRPVYQETVAPSEKSAMRALFAGDPAPVPTITWRPGLRSLTGAQLAAQVLWFNCALHEEGPWSRMFAPGTWLAEREMIQWAEQGIVYLRDVMLGARIATRAEFSEQFPMLDGTLIDHLHRSIPAEWHATLRDGSANSWGWHAIPSDLFDGEDDEGPWRPQYAVHIPQTLVSRPLVRTKELRVTTG